MALKVLIVDDEPLARLRLRTLLGDCHAPAALVCGEAGNAGAGADWLYTYLRSFYRDEERPTGWNNTVFENVGMPHILYGLQGQQVRNHETHKLELAVPGTMAPAEFDKAVSDLVGFMVWMGEPQQEFRQKLGFFVLAFLALLFVVAYALKKEYWKDIH